LGPFRVGLIFYFKSSDDTIFFMAASINHSRMKSILMPELKVFSFQNSSLKSILMPELKVFSFQNSKYSHVLRLQIHL
jgi:predicted nuclease of restriction endonuclease-like (RecB) superfamily